jgi:hypothetical protein
VDAATVASVGKRHDGTRLPSLATDSALYLGN